MRDETTRTGGEAAVDAMEATGSAVPALTVVHHRDPALIGQRTLLGAAGETVLGRGSAQFDASVFDQSSVSRRHCAVFVSKAGAVRVADVGSRNGTRVNGVAVPSADLVRGDVLGIGDVLLLFHEAPSAPPIRSVTGMDTASAAMQQVMASAARLAPSERTILIEGPSGVGKEIVAREIHARSGRRGEWVAVNCGAVSDQLLLSDLFGHARGSFSGAGGDRVGLVERARGGTLFFDEIGDASPAFQVALLRLLEQREYRRVGEDAPRSTDARFLAATHVPLASAVAAGRFRADLLGRIAGFALAIPALCERPDDIVPLALAFARKRAGADRRLSARLTLAMLRYRWPLNVRELSAVVEMAQIEADPGAPLDLTPDVARRLTGQPGPVGPGSAPTPPPIARRAKPRSPSPERPRAEDLRAGLERASGNMRRLATEMGVARSTLYRWFAELEIDGRAGAGIAPDSRS